MVRDPEKMLAGKGDIRGRRRPGKVRPRGLDVGQSVPDPASCPTEAQARCRAQHDGSRAAPKADADADHVLRDYRGTTI